MSASVEALAMAGVDYKDVARDFNSIDDYIPPYLLVKNYEGWLCLSKRSELDREGSDGGSFYCELKCDEETRKKNLVGWAKAVSKGVKNEVNFFEAK